jgi:hypothetical protein
LLGLFSSNISNMVLVVLDWKLLYWLGYIRRLLYVEHRVTAPFKQSSPTLMDSNIFCYAPLCSLEFQQLCQTKEEKISNGIGAKI